LPQRVSQIGDRMTGWSGWGSWPIGLIALVIGLAIFFLVMTVPLEFYEQLIFAIVGLVVALIFRLVPGRPATLVLILLSVVISARYLYWRVTETAVLDSLLEFVLSIGLMLAELYAISILLLGYFQTAWPLRRRPVELPRDTAQWPAVDVMIPTYNEPLSVVKPTVLAAMSLDWPAGKLNVCILDDGKRPEFKEFAEQIGATYLMRRDNRHAKAGNINEALKRTQGEFVAIFDCDHIPTRSFLQTTMGWFLRDPHLGMVQTPHHFFSPDPFEKNLGVFRRVPNEGELFYGLVQAGNDLWNATFFCGSAAIMRRRALDEVGGIATDTLTEDAHTSLNMHRAGFTSAYIGIPQASGLGTETLRDHARQRSRWARGMAQIFRLDNPLFTRGLSFAQRLCYSNAMLHFFYGLPRIVFLTAPLAFLYFGLHVFNATALMIAVFALPHFIHAYIANSRLSGPYRHAFWAEVFEATLAWHVMRAAVSGFFRPRTGSFVVTPKGQVVDADYFDWRTSAPIVILFFANVIGIVLGVIRFFWWNTGELDTVIMNMAWTVFNLIVLGASIAVAREVHQIRDSHRVTVRLPAELTLANGQTVNCEISDFSEGGVGLRAPAGVHLTPNERVTLGVYRGERRFGFPASVAFGGRDHVGLRFDKMTLAQEAQFLQCTFARADAWLRWTQGRDRDRPLRGFREVFVASLLGVWALITSIFGGGRRRESRARYDSPGMRPARTAGE
jgi:cellulose synthase (UDP-forming)